MHNEHVLIERTFLNSVLEAFETDDWLKKLTAANALRNKLQSNTSPQLSADKDDNLYLQESVSRLQEKINTLYSERNALAIAFAKASITAGSVAGRSTEGEESTRPVEWRNVVYVDLPGNKQVSWHISPDDAHLLNGLPEYTKPWDQTYFGRDKTWVEQVPCSTPLLTASEQAYALSNPIVIGALMDHHEFEQGCADAIGIGSNGNLIRRASLKATGAKIIEADPDIWPADIVSYLGAKPGAVSDDSKRNTQRLMDLARRFRSAPGDLYDEAYKDLEIFFYRALSKVTPGSQWRLDKKSDPHGNLYDAQVERGSLTLGHLTDDELANEAFLRYDQRPALDDLISGRAYSPLTYMTATKERIRWLSRSLEAALMSKNYPQKVSQDV